MVYYVVNLNCRSWPLHHDAGAELRRKRLSHFRKLDCPQCFQGSGSPRSPNDWSRFGEETLGLIGRRGLLEGSRGCQLGSKVYLAGKPRPLLGIFIRNFFTLFSSSASAFFFTSLHLVPNYRLLPQLSLGSMIFSDLALGNLPGRSCTRDISLQPRYSGEIPTFISTPSIPLRALPQALA